MKSLNRLGKKPERLMEHSVKELNVELREILIMQTLLGLNY
jgi:hypothetical protein